MRNFRMKKVYIVAAYNNIQFAEKLLSRIKNIKIVKTELGKTDDINAQIKKEIYSSDIILTVIDDKFTKNKMLEFELYLAQMSMHENRNKLLIPVVLDNAEVPTELEEVLYIPCETGSEEDLNKAQLLIENLVMRSKYPVKQRRTKEKNSRTVSMIILTIAIEIFAVLFVFLSFQESTANIFHAGNDNFFPLMLEIMSVMLAIVALFTSYFSIMKKRWQEDGEEELESYSRRLKQAVIPRDTKEEQQNSAGKKEVDALGRMMINLEDIKEFYTWSQKQAKASFILAVSMCISGFVLMVVAILLPVVFRLSFQMSIIPAVGGAITEVIAGTALIVYRNSLSQLNHYHKALHEDERFLSSVNLLGKFSTVEARDDMLREIIRSEIQMNLAVIHENVKSDSSSIKENSKK